MQTLSPVCRCSCCSSASAYRKDSPQWYWHTSLSVSYTHLDGAERLMIGGSTDMRCHSDGGEEIGSSPLHIDTCQLRSAALLRRVLGKRQYLSLIHILGRAESDVCQYHCGESLRYAEADEQQEQRHTGDNVCIHHRDCLLYTSHSAGLSGWTSRMGGCRVWSSAVGHPRYAAHECRHL